MAKPRDLFTEYGISMKPEAPRDLFAERGISTKKMQTPTKNREFPMPSYPFVNRAPTSQEQQQAGSELTDFAKGASQAYINTPEEAANVFGKHMYNKFDYAPKTAAAQVGGVAGDIGSYFMPTNALTSVAKTLSYIPKAEKAINAMAAGLKSKPVTNYLLNMAKNFGEGALFQKEKNPQSSGKDVAEAGTYGAALPALLQAVGSTNPLMSMGAKMAVGGTMGYQADGWQGAGEGAIAGLAVPKMLKEIGALPSAPVASEFLTESPNVLAKSRYEAGNRLGTPVRPSEAFDNTSIAGKEAQVAHTEIGSTAMGDEAKIRVQKQKTAINNMLNKLYPKTDKADEEIRQYYANAYQHNMTDNKMSALFEDPVLTQAANKITNDPAYMKDLKNVRANNFAYLDQVKRVVDDMEKAAIKAGENNKARIYGDSSQKLIKEMDKVSTDYEKARNAAQKKITRREIEKAIGKKEINGRTFFDQVLKNDNNYNDLLVKLKNSPEALQDVKDMKLAWEHLIGKDTVRTKAGQTEKSTNTARQEAQFFWSKFKDTVGAPRDVERAKFIHDPRWWDKFDEVMAYQNKVKRRQALAELFGRSLSAGALETAKDTK